MTGMKRTHRYLLYEVTKRCQNSCVFCYNVWKEAGAYPEEELATADAIRLLDKVFGETSCEFIGLTGGEPLLRDDIFEIAAFISSKKVLPVLISNGQLLSRETVSRCRSSGIEHFEVSLHGHTPGVHDRLAGREGSFEEVIDAILNIKAAGGQVNTVFVATKENIASFKEYIELNALLRVNWILFNRVACGGTCLAGWEPLAPSPSEIQMALEVGAPLAEKYKIGLSVGVQIQPCLIDLSLHANVAASFCPLNDPSSSSSYFAIDPAGNLRMCNRSRIILGNLLREPFEKISSSAAVEEFGRVVPDFCSGCRIARTCAGGCKADAYARFGTLTRPDPYLEMYQAQAKKLR